MGIGDWEIDWAVQQSSYPITRLPNPQSASDVFIEHLFQVVLLRQADNRLDHLTTLEDENRRNAPDLELEGNVGVLIDVELADGHFPRVLRGEGIDGRTEPFARATPFRPEVH